MDNGLVQIQLHKYLGKEKEMIKSNEKINYLFRRIAANEFDKQVNVHVAMDNTLVLEEIR